MTDGIIRKPMEMREWKALVADGEEPSDIILHKEYTANFKSLSEDQPQERLVDFVLNTGKADRYNDTVAGIGWELENYLKNPVVLWHHNQSFLAGPGVMPHGGLPIGKGVNLSVDGDTLLGSAQFFKQSGDDRSEAAKFIETVYQMVEGGFLNAVSVGFAPNEYEYNDERGGTDFTSQELLEFSVVPIPADSDALRRAVQKGIDVGPVHGWAVKMLESGDDLVVPRKKLEAVVKSLGFGRGMKFFDMPPIDIKKAIKARTSLDEESHLVELENKILLQAEMLESLNEINEKQAGNIDELEETISDMVLKSFEALDEHLDGEVVVEYINHDDADLVTTEELGIEPGLLDEWPDDGTLVLRVADQEENTLEDEEIFRFNPDDLMSAIEGRISEKMVGLKQLFTKATGKVL